MPGEILVLELVVLHHHLLELGFVYLLLAVVQEVQITLQDLPEDLEVAEVTVRVQEKLEQEQLTKEKEVLEDLSPVVAEEPMIVKLAQMVDLEVVDLEEIQTRHQPQTKVEQEIHLR